MFIGLIVEIIGNRHHIFIDNTYLEAVLAIDGVF
jgi:hypothetical protein